LWLAAEGLKVVGVKISRWKLARDFGKPIAALAALEYQAFAAGWSPSSDQQQLLLRYKHAIVVAELDNMVIGYAVVIFRGAQANLCSIVVDPACRGRGLGSRLLAVAERYGRTRATITLEVRNDNRTALNLYRRHGYSECGRLPKYYGDGADAVCLQKNHDLKK
jgi:ribosomal-protein-alanine acetyltransferase